MLALRSFSEAVCSREESNLDNQLRRLVFYPLNYESLGVGSEYYETEKKSISNYFVIHDSCLSSEALAKEGFIIHNSLIAPQRA